MAPPRTWSFVLLVIALIGLGALLVSDISQFAWICRKYAERAELGPAQLSFPVSPKEAIVVLTGDHTRIPRAIELLRTRGTPLLIISGAGKGITLTALVNQQGSSTVGIHQTWEKIVLESRSASTLENARESAEILKSRGIERIILVTSEYHMHRSAAIFRQEMPGVELVEYPVPSEVSGLSFVPSSRNLTGLWKIWNEYWKLFLFEHQLPRIL